MAKMTFDAPENQASDAAILDAAGKYHVVVDWVELNPVKSDGTMIDNAVFRAHCIVLDGTTPNQRDKQLALMFFAPKMTDKGGGEMAKQKIRNFATAIGCCELTPDGQMVITFGPEPGEPAYDEGDERIDSKYAAGRQLICEVEKDKDGKFMQLRYSNCWHVDHPAVKDVPKCKEHLKLLPPELRKAAKDFAKPGKAGTTTKAPSAPPAGDKVEVSDL